MKGSVVRFCAVLLVAACSGSSGGDAQSAADGDEESTDSDSDADSGSEPETEYERTLQRAKERREQCDALATAVQQAEKPGQHIVNLNDGSKLNQLANDIDDGVKSVERLKVSLEELESLRTRYISAAKEMAKALHETAATKDDKGKKASLARYRELDARTHQVIEDINHTCSQEASTEGEE